MPARKNQKRPGVFIKNVSKQDETSFGDMVKNSASHNENLRYPQVEHPKHSGKLSGGVVRQSASHNFEQIRSNPNFPYSNKRRVEGLDSYSFPPRQKRFRREDLAEGFSYDSDVLDIEMASNCGKFSFCGKDENAQGLIAGLPHASSYQNMAAPANQEIRRPACASSNGTASVISTLVIDGPHQKNPLAVENEFLKKRIADYEMRSPSATEHLPTFPPNLSLGGQISSDKVWKKIHDISASNLKAVLRLNHEISENILRKNGMQEPPADISMQRDNAFAGTNMCLSLNEYKKIDLKRLFDDAN